MHFDRSYLSVAQIQAEKFIPLLLDTGSPHGHAGLCIAQHQNHVILMAGTLAPCPVYLLSMRECGRMSSRPKIIAKIRKHDKNPYISSQKIET